MCHVPLTLTAFFLLLVGAKNVAQMAQSAENVGIPTISRAKKVAQGWHSVAHVPQSWHTVKNLKRLF